MEVIGFLAALLVGISLGLIGGGGSILTVPILVYLLQVDPVLATAYSLFVVGAASMVGAFNNWRKKMVSLKTAFVFAVPSFIAVYCTRLYLVPNIPDPLVQMGDFVLTKNMAIMVFFAIIMLVAAISMITKKRDNIVDSTPITQQFNYPLIIAEGAIVGVLTGIVGAGGGFLIIPALVLFSKLPMKLAVGTSLTIVTAKSLIGFIGDIQAGQLIDWPFLLLFTGLAVIGIFMGGYLSNFISGKKLQKGFGWFVLVMAIYIVCKEIIFK